LDFWVFGFFSLGLSAIYRSSDERAVEGPEDTSKRNKSLVDGSVEGPLLRCLKGVEQSTNGREKKISPIDWA
jgi:hypothetical protein